MFLKKSFVLFCAGLVISASAFGVELRFKFEKDQSRAMDIKVNLKGNLEVTGSANLVGSANGTVQSKIDMKTLQVDEKGIATIENKLHGFQIHLESEAQVGDASHSFEIDLNENGGKVTQDGVTTQIPAPAMNEAQNQSWTTQLDSRGTQVGMDLNAEGLSGKEAEDMKNLSQSVTALMGNNGVLPEEDVEVGHKWEQTLKVEELTKQLSKDNPMLSTIPDLGIPDLTTKYTLTDLRDEGGNQLATINSTTQFEWTNGELPLGIINVSVKRLAITSESLTDINNTEGYSPRTTGVTTIDFDLVVNTPFGQNGPGVYNVTGQLRTDIESLTE